VINKFCRDIVCRVLFAGLCLHGAEALATEMVYTPVNPTFGGNPQNASGLQANATSQNHFTAPTTTQTALEKFQNALQSAVISRLTSKISGATSTELKEFTLTDGNTTQVGIYKLAVSKDANGNLQMVTTDTTNGQTATIVIGEVGN
jgi:curli production assembly/transport component CsgF